MEDLGLFQILFILGAAGSSAAILINALFETYVRKNEWRRWGPFD